MDNFYLELPHMIWIWWKNNESKCCQQQTNKQTNKKQLSMTHCVSNIYIVCNVYVRTCPWLLYSTFNNITLSWRREGGRGGEGREGGRELNSWCCTKSGVHPTRLWSCSGCHRQQTAAASWQSLESLCSERRPWEQSWHPLHRWGSYHLERWGHRDRAM